MNYHFWQGLSGFFHFYQVSRIPHNKEGMTGSATVNPLPNRAMRSLGHRDVVAFSLCQAPLHKRTPALIVHSVFYRSCSGYKDWPIYLSKITIALVESPEQLCKVTLWSSFPSCELVFFGSWVFPKEEDSMKKHIIPHPSSSFFSTDTYPTLYSLPSSLAVLFQSMKLLWLSPLCPNLKALSLDIWNCRALQALFMSTHFSWYVHLDLMQSLKKKKQPTNRCVPGGKEHKCTTFWQYSLTHKNDWGNWEDSGRALPQTSDLHKGKVLYFPWDWFTPALNCLCGDITSARFPSEAKYKKATHSEVTNLNQPPLPVSIVTSCSKCLAEILDPDPMNCLCNRILHADRSLP